jgi:hypothetical protein
MGFHLFMCVMPLPENGILGNYSLPVGEVADNATFQEVRVPLVLARSHDGAMMDGMFYKLRGIAKWPSTIATVSSTEIVGTGGRAGRTMNIYFDYNVGSSSETGKLFVDDNSSLYGMAQGEQFSIQFNPKRPANYYCSEAKSLSQTIRRGVIMVGVAFAIVVFVVEFFGNSRR